MEIYQFLKTQPLDDMTTEEIGLLFTLLGGVQWRASSCWDVYEGRWFIAYHRNMGFFCSLQGGSWRPTWKQVVQEMGQC